MDDLWHELNQHWGGLEKLEWWCERTYEESGLTQWVSPLAAEDRYEIHMKGITSEALTYFDALKLIRNNGVAVMSYRLQEKNYG